MKIAILTQPLHNNYGGLLQAFALQKVLKKKLNIESETLDIGYSSSFISKLKGVVKLNIDKFIFQKKIRPQFKPTEEQKKKIATHTDAFKNEYIKLGQGKYTKQNLGDLQKLNYDGYVVGSDQVWRPRYSPNIQTYFLNFLKNNSTSKRISYAASFGVDFNEFKDRDLYKCASLLQKFDAVSVREEGAVKLCETKFGVKSKLVLDPTLLLEVDDYKAFFDKDLETKKQIMFYVLDPEYANKEIETSVKEYFDLPLFKIMPKAMNEESVKNIKDCIYPPVEDWIEGFLTSEFIITDSFHGTIFSILFNKQFITIGNEVRGMSRFNSVLKIFNLQDRLVSDLDGIKKVLKTKIDYTAVNKILETEKEKSLDFLKESLLK
ncbi:polysaccharide pyruvyl transferase family protein [Wenyingzhuangia sp. chi5]|uniref:Polysaccharide pyruvyl transferase family protein n=1 Tax=Wenyingzhuangia gilva TaxID=3057677 RepID=A0ABT8VNT3_9FLAO|nr:polysaccharide pyruvyl transferase family protein [Wenyingzhuangia sp. chi5]MDO3693634.1 polysaccharide pyruvyl transferase family protein [Wenyingzhuangia sp. chi5]